LQLKELNAFFKDSLAVEVNEGYLGIWSELSVKEGHVDGYVKPLVQKLDVSRVQDPNLGQVLKAFAVEVVTAIFHNRPHQQFGAKVELKGSLNKPDVSTWDTIVSVLGNAFIRALEPKLDQTVATEAEQDKKPAMDKEAEKMRKSQEKTKAEADKK